MNENPETGPAGNVQAGTEKVENQDLKRRLRRTWSTFFGQAGSLLAAQKMAVLPVLEGKNALIVSPAAGGIPEAVLAPLCEKLLEEGKRGLAVLYLVPTGALAGEIFNMLREQNARPGLRVSKKTGTRPDINEENPPDILITTPESLDSLLCRHPGVFEELQAVVLDEIHSIDGSCRGDQVRLLLERLREIAGKFSVYAFSAVSGDAIQPGERYMDDFQVLRAGGEREVNAAYTASFEEIFELSRERQLKKVLVFCNTREKAEEIAALLGKLPGPSKVVVHHEGLSKWERDEAENFMKNSVRGTCVSAMPPEIGIEAGDLDAIVFGGVPPDLSSFVQRIGTAGRRTGFVNVFFLCDSRLKTLFELLLDYTKQAHLEGSVYSPDLSVAVQQIFSVLYSSPRGVNEDYLYGLFNNFCAYEDLKSIIEELLAAGLVSSRNRKIYASEFIMNLGEEGTLHSNISPVRTIEAVNARTGKEIGEVQLPVNCIRDGQAFTLEGKFWEIVEMEDSKAYVKKSTVKGVFNSLRTASRMGAFFEYLPEKIQKSELEKWQEV